MPRLRRLAAPVNARKHKICFTHADLAIRNVLVKDGRLSGIIDWAFSGWYPEYGELVLMENQMRNERLSNEFWDATQLFGPETSSHWNGRCGTARARSRGRLKTMLKTT
ncbi:hypothetical protein BC628DRAFT_1357670 [Trametes gibbosa]|nr:hypothetical protein BC628DRAFT_1357670 [Trametes gibbosa]